MPELLDYIIRQWLDNRTDQRTNNTREFEHPRIPKGLSQVSFSQESRKIFKKIFRQQLLLIEFCTTGLTGENIRYSSLIFLLSPTSAARRDARHPELVQPLNFFIPLLFILRYRTVKFVFNIKNYIFTTISKTPVRVTCRIMIPVGEVSKS